MKKCLECNEDKFEYDFYKHAQKKDGLNPYCKVCVKKQNEERYVRKRDQYRLAQKEYYKKNSEKIKEQVKKWSLNNKQRIIWRNKEKYAKYTSEQHEKALERKRRFDKSQKGKESSKKYRQGEKWVARYTFRNAIRDGKIQKIDTCSLCKSNERVEGHHSDYSKPLDVIWVCRKCHSAIHRSIKERSNNASKISK